MSISITRTVGKPENGNAAQNAFDALLAARHLRNAGIVITTDIIGGDTRVHLTAARVLSTPSGLVLLLKLEWRNGADGATWAAMLPRELRRLRPWLRRVHRGERPRAVCFTARASAALSGLECWCAGAPRLGLPWTSGCDELCPRHARRAMRSAA